MVALMEMASARAMAGILEDGELTAGVTINVTHSAATPPGLTVRARARFLGMVGKFYRFEVVAEDDAGEIGRGLHDRAIVRHARLLEGAERRRPKT
jgi:predicted thioesterase